MKANLIQRIALGAGLLAGSLGGGCSSLVLKTFYIPMPEKRADPNYLQDKQTNYSNNQQTSGNQLNQNPQAEYQSALQEYNNAVKKLNETRTIMSLPRAYPVPGMGLAIGVLGNVELNKEESDVEVARERLHRAEIRLHVPQDNTGGTQDNKLIENENFKEITTQEDLNNHQRKYVTKRALIVAPCIKNPPAKQLCNFYTYRRWEDINKNGILEEAELFGIDNQFRKEPFNLIYIPGINNCNSFVPVGTFSSYKLKMVGPNAKQVFEQFGTVELGRFLHIEITNDKIEKLINEFGYGTYKTTVEVNNKTEIIDFEIIQ